jgi:stage II sporulation protein D
MLLTALLLAACAHANPSDGLVRVKIFPHNSRLTAPEGAENPARFRLSSAAGCARYAANGETAINSKAAPLERANSFQFDAATLFAPAWIECAQPATLEREGGASARYAGSFFVKKIEPEKGAAYLTVVNVLPLEDYLRAVVPAEMNASWPAEALKAQAVAARTYALFELSGDESNRDPRIASEVSGAELDDTVFFQAYEGEGRRTHATDVAVEKTRGLTLTSGGRLLKAYFHSDSGGRTADCAAAFGTPLPYCVEREDEGRAPTTTWTARFSPTDLSRRLARAQLIPSGKEVENIDSGNGNNRPEKALASFQGGGSALLDPRELRFALGLKSAWFRFAREGSSLVVHGRGAGHGAGMSQWGARRLAERKVGFERILKHYYAGARLTSVAELDTVPGTLMSARLAVNHGAGVDEVGTQTMLYDLLGSSTGGDQFIEIDSSSRAHLGEHSDQIFRAGVPGISGSVLGSPSGRLATDGADRPINVTHTQL